MTPVRVTVLRGYRSQLAEPYLQALQVTLSRSCPHSEGGSLVFPQDARYARGNLLKNGG